MATEGLGISCDAAACKWRTRGDDDLRPADGEERYDADVEEGVLLGSPFTCMMLDEVAGDDKFDRDATRNMWDFVFPVSFHHVVLHALRAAESHLFLLARSAHPGLHVAARERHLKVVALMA